ncbi:MAG: hypothetical protein O3C43_22910 [Verrucomicrobia bacterium]|nr:hypothetical protein [Verrucomicrobiota bacterium]
MRIKIKKHLILTERMPLTPGLPGSARLSLIRLFNHEVMGYRTATKAGDGRHGLFSSNFKKFAGLLS